MGTRHLTIVKLGGKTKISQYGQWDGYPSGQGANVLKFLNEDCNFEVFKEQVSNLVDITDEELGKKFEELLGHNKDMINLSESELIEKTYPEFHRNTGSDILYLVHNEGIKSVNVIEDDSWCEWTYTIDLDTNKLIVGIGANQEFDLDNLPTQEQFLACLEKRYKVVVTDTNGEVDSHIACDLDEVEYIVNVLDSETEYKVKKFDVSEMKYKEVDYVV